MLHANAILASLSASDTAALRSHLKATHLQQKTVLYEAGDTIDTVYFPITAMVGKDGAVGIASAMDGKVAVCRADVQLSGDAMICDPTSFKSTAMQSESLISKVMRHEQTLFAQAQQSTACMANHEVEARLCRWLLRARDLSESDRLPFTQEYLAEMLGVRRTSVTTVARTLQEAGIVKYTRGKIEIIDVEGLREGACECYETVKEQYRQLLGPLPSLP
jgi:CRP-like cAMP-binding protein